VTETADDVQVELETLRTELRPLDAMLSERVASETKSLTTLTEEKARCLARVERADEREVELEGRRVEAETLRQNLTVTKRDRLVASLLASGAIGTACLICVSWVVLMIKGVPLEGLGAQAAAVITGVVTANLIRRKARRRLKASE